MRHWGRPSPAHRDPHSLGARRRGAAPQCAGQTPALAPARPPRPSASPDLGAEARKEGERELLQRHWARAAGAGRGGGAAGAPPRAGAWNVPAALHFVLGLGEGGAGQGSRGPASWTAASFPFPGSLWGEGRRRT